jgi:hypothetical protein
MSQEIFGTFQLFKKHTSRIQYLQYHNGCDITMAVYVDSLIAELV